MFNTNVIIIFAVVNSHYLDKTKNNFIFLIGRTIFEEHNNGPTLKSGQKIIKRTTKNGFLKGMTTKGLVINSNFMSY